MEDPREIAACTHLLFIGRNFEQMGHLAVNIAESVVRAIREAPVPHTIQAAGSDSSVRSATAMPFSGP